MLFVPRVKPLGVMDLKVVKQKLVKYEPGEIAHIENVLKSEIRIRDHRRLRQTEEIFVSEVETTEETEKELETTERFELQRESEESIKEETNLKAGVKISASYGLVSVNAYGEYASTTAKEQSDRTASNFVKSITEKSVSKVSERIREERTRRTLEEFEEKNRHEFQNAKGEHIVGIYRWVDKYFRTKEFDYGRRLTYEFLIPEPATFYLFTKLEQKDVPDEPDKPRIMIDDDWKDLISPDQITRENYLTLLNGRRIEGLKAPPLANIRLQGGYVLENTGDDFPVSKLMDAIRIPDGYVAALMTINNYVRRSGAWDHLAMVDRRNEYYRFPDGGYIYKRTRVAGAGVNEVIKVAATRDTSTEKHVALFEVDCIPMNTTMKRWQLETYDLVMAAYEEQKLDYEERVAALETQKGIQISGNNPLINREIERTELKRSCIDIWFGRAIAIELFDAPRWFIFPEENYPFLNPINVLSEARNEVKFLENAFEWENMTYEFYPYNWATREKWLDLLSIEDNDPLFQQFLRAGAAVVRVPVKRERTRGMLYFQKTGTLWPGDEEQIPAFDPSDTEGALYNSYITDIFADDVLDNIDQDVTLDADTKDTHIIKVPTSLIWLQQDTYLLPDLESETQ